MNNVNKVESNRDFLFDNMKGILIILVVFAHTINISEHPYPLVKAIYGFIYFFHMPAFIFISGYFSKNPDKCSKNAFQSYFIPYLIVNTLSFIQEYLQWMQLDAVAKAEEPFILFRIFTPLFGCWFLLAMFVWKTMLKDIIRIRFNILFLFILGIAAGYSHEFYIKFSLSRIMVFFVFFILGYYTTAEHVKWIRSKIKLLPILCFIFAFFVSWYLINLEKVGTDFLLGRLYYDEGFETEGAVLRIIFYFFAIILTISLIHLTGEKKSFLTKIGQNSVTVYILHLFLDRFSAFHIEPIISSMIHSQWIYLLYTLLFSLIIVFLTSRQVVKNTYSGFMNRINRIIFKTDV